MQTRLQPPPLTSARRDVSVLRVKCCVGGVGVLSTSPYKRLDTELAEDTWTDPRL